MKQPKPVVIDVETFGIENRPNYPPVPVGVSIKYYGKKAKYYGFGHLSGNNCCWSDAKAALVAAYNHHDGVLFQNAKFDVDVIEEHFGLPIPPWSKIEDTLFLLFLDDPHQTELGLKPSAARLLDMPAEEQDAVADWLIANQPVPGVKLSKAKSSDNYFGGYISHAPGDLVGRYADGDVIRTELLFAKLWPSIVERGMLECYDRERQLMPILLEMERQGVPVDLPRLRADVSMYNQVRDRLNAWVIKHLKVAPDINLDSGAQLVKAMLAVGKADGDLLGRTPTGQYKTDKESLLAGVTDKVLLAALKYRTQLNTCLNTFMETWLRVAEQSGGKIFTTWNQTKSTEGAGSVGTRTGRLSSTPNFQNIPNVFEPIFAHEAKDKKQAAKLPKSPIKDLPPLPMVRGYVTSWDETHILLDRDYSQQELRILGHFEDGVLRDAYTEDPWLDVHDYAREMISQMLNREFDRKPIKNTGFGLIYGMGLGKLAAKSDITVEAAKEVKDAYLAIFPGLKAMYQDMKRRAQANLPIHTWGGREYYCEPPKLVDGRLRTFDYKMLNVLIQGSAADCTKEAVIRYWAMKPGHHKLLLTVHDEILISVPREEMAEAMDLLRQAMESVTFDVPMLSEGAWSSTNWSKTNLQDYDTKGELCYAAK